MQFKVIQHHSIKPKLKKKNKTKNVLFKLFTNKIQNEYKLQPTKIQITPTLRVDTLEDSVIFELLPTRPEDEKEKEKGVSVKILNLVSIHWFYSKF